MIKTARTWTLVKQSDGVRGMRGHEKQYIVCVVEYTHFSAYVRRFKVQSFWGKEELAKDELQMTESKTFLSLTEAKIAANALVDKNMDKGYTLCDLEISDLQYA